MVRHERRQVVLDAFTLDVVKRHTSLRTSAA
jgi:hypothetical protein